ncbi:hypothetical protein ACS0TY_034889 [Phlomoides rotata]
MVSKFPLDHEINSKIYLWRGNPWNLENLDEAHSSPGLHAAAGPGLAEECATLDFEENGSRQREEADIGRGGSEKLDGELVLSIEKLQEIQDELEKINEQASEEVVLLEQKYNEVQKPVYDKRNELIKSIPDFWLTAFMSHPALGELLTEGDQKIFK